MKLRVNGEEITEQELEAEYKRQEHFFLLSLPPEALKGKVAELKAQAKEIAIGRCLLLQEARRRELTVSDARFAEGLRSLIAAAGGPAAWNVALREKTVDYQSACSQLRTALLVEEAVKQITKDVAPPSPAEIAFYYAENAEKLVTDQAKNSQEPPALDEVKDKIRVLLSARKRNAVLTEYISQLREAALIEEDLKSKECN